MKEGPTLFFTLLRRKPQFLRPWMNAERVPFEALEEWSRVCFGGFRLPARSRFGEGRPSEACGGATGFSPWGSTSRIIKSEMSTPETLRTLILTVQHLFLNFDRIAPSTPTGVGVDMMAETLLMQIKKSGLSLGEFCDWVGRSGFAPTDQELVAGAAGSTRSSTKTRRPKPGHYREGMLLVELNKSENKSKAIVLKGEGQLRVSPSQFFPSILIPTFVSCCLRSWKTNFAAAVSSSRPMM